MAEEATIAAPVEETTQTQEAPSPFAQTAWTTEIPNVEPAKTEDTNTPAPTPASVGTTTPAEGEEILDTKDWLKRELDVDDIAVIKAEREEYKKLKETTPAEIKFADDTSKQVYELLREGKVDEVIDIYSTKKKIDKVVAMEVNKDTAAEFIKLNMALKYKDLSADEINYKYDKQFSIPKEPKQAIDELDEDFAERKSAWQEQVNDIQMNKIIEAKLAKPEIEKLKAQINLPTLTPQATNAPTPEVLAAQEEATKVERQNFLNKLESDYVKFDGYATKVKDESVEIPVSFKAPDEAKVAIKERFKAGFDLNGFIDKRWSDDSGNQRIEQIISDIYVLENLDKVLSGVANNAANQRLAEYIKSIKNPNIGTTPQQTYQQSNGNSGVSPFAKGAWSEKPPVLNN